ncbi:MAG: hypothetical protein NTV06_06970 [candidate division Zixibacteria bacterium]|nr:hypothetical protein [candidate division Zixibacteria bacterium]
MCQHKIAIIIGILSVIFIVGIIACNKDSVSPPLQLGLGTYNGTYKVIQDYDSPPNQQTVLIDTMKFVFGPGNGFRSDTIPEPGHTYDFCPCSGIFLKISDSLKITITETNPYVKICNPDLTPGGDYKLIDNQGDSLIYGALSGSGTIYQRIALQGR